MDVADLVFAAGRGCCAMKGNRQRCRQHRGAVVNFAVMDAAAPRMDLVTHHRLVRDLLAPSRVKQSKGSWTPVVRQEKGFHHAAIQTRSYRERFGHPAFACTQATHAGSFGSGRLRLETGFGVHVIDGAGWKADRGNWPEESGGAATFARIQARCREIRSDRSKVVRLRAADRGVDAVFAELVEPERQRQRRLILGAIERLLILLDLSRIH